MKVCDQKDCTKPALFEVAWPGNSPMEMCWDCAMRAKYIARAMGFDVYMDRLSSPPRAANDEAETT